MGKMIAFPARTCYNDKCGFLSIQQKKAAGKEEYSRPWTLETCARRRGAITSETTTKGGTSELSSIIEVQDLRKVYRLGTEKVVALGNLNFSVEKGEICCILGTSGSGKSTLLNMLAGLEKPTRGQVLIHGTPITTLSENKLAVFRQQYTGFVFQSYNLMPALTAIENVALPLMFRGVPPKDRNAEAVKALEDVGLGNRVKHKPNQMSGGQQQRVGIARAFIAKPSVVFADEPTGNLDTRTTKDVMELMVNMARAHDLTLVLVTHDRDIARYADRIIQLIDGDIAEDITNDALIPRRGSAPASVPDAPPEEAPVMEPSLQN